MPPPSASEKKKRIPRVPKLSQPAAVRVDVYGCTPASDNGHGWTRYVHINGGVYYYHAQNGLITECDVTKECFRDAVLKEFDDFMAEGEDYSMVNSTNAGRNRDAVLWFDEVDEMEMEQVAGGLDLVQAFFVCHEHKSESRYDGDKVVVEHDTYRYWTHVEAYPMHVDPLVVIPTARACFLDAITFVFNARIFEDARFILPFTDSQVERILELYQSLSDTMNVNPSVAPVLIWFLARIIREVKQVQEGVAMGMSCYTHTQIDGRAGFAIRRLPPVRPVKSVKRDTPLAPEIEPAPSTWHLTTAEALFTVVLLGTQRAYRKRLEKTRVAASVNLEDFRDVIQGFLAQWTDTNLLATVFVGGNVSFLALADITSMQRTASLASAIFSLVSITSGLYHVWHHRIKTKADQVEAVKYVYHVQGPDGRGESDMIDPVIMSFFLAIPVASLLWALLCFSIALAAYCVQGPDLSGNIRVVLALAIGIGVSVAAAAAVVLRNMGRERPLAASCV